jgi:periplasmic protein TonB
MNPAQLPDGGFVHDLFERSRRRRGLTLVMLVIAVAGHAVAGTLAPTGAEHAKVPPPVEVEFLPPEPPPLPPPLPAPEPEKVEPAKATRAPAERAPEPAQAGRLLTAKPEAPPEQSNEPVDFVSDPNGTTYGGGVVAIGGKAAVGKAGARAGVASHGDAVEAGPRRPAGDGLVAASDLSRAPRLNESDPCRGFFPRNASNDTAQASVLVTIGKNGGVSSARVVAENPAGQGFGQAARACMMTKRFVPALDRSGDPAATALRVNVRFSR